MNFEFDAEDIPTMEELKEWYEVNEELKKLRVREILLRDKMFKGFFKNPYEGVNTIPLHDDWVLKADYKFYRSIDGAAFLALREDFVNSGIDVDKVVRVKVELALKSYNALSPEKKQLFDQVVTTKPGTPALGIVKAKK